MDFFKILTGTIFHDNMVLNRYFSVNVTVDIPKTSNMQYIMIQVLSLKRWGTLIYR